MPRFPHAIATASLAALLLAGCGSADEPEAGVTPSQTPTTSEPSESATPTESDAVAETVDVTTAPPPQAEGGLLVTNVAEPLTRTGEIPVVSGTFGTPDGTVEIYSVERTGSLPGHLLASTGLAQPELTYVPADGEEFFVFDIAFVPGDDNRTPAAEVHVESAGTKRLVQEMSPGESTFVVSLPADAEGARLLVSADGHDQVFDIAAGERVADPLTDVYLRPVTQQDLTDVLTYDQLVVGEKERDYSADIRLRSARITPYVPPRVDSQGWAEPGRMWLILEYEVHYDGVRKQNSTVSWSAKDAESVVQEGRLWMGSGQEVVMDIPAASESIELEVTNRLEVTGGIADFGSQAFTVNFPNEG